MCRGNLTLKWEFLLSKSLNFFALFETRKFADISSFIFRILNFVIVGVPYDKFNCLNESPYNETVISSINAVSIGKNTNFLGGNKQIPFLNPRDANG